MEYDSFQDWVKGRIVARVRDRLHDQSLDSYKIVNPPPHQPRLAPRISWVCVSLIDLGWKETNIMGKDCILMFNLGYRRLGT